MKSHAIRPERDRTSIRDRGGASWEFRRRPSPSLVNECGDADVRTLVLGKGALASRTPGSQRDKRLGGRGKERPKRGASQMPACVERGNLFKRILNLVGLENVENLADLKAATRAPLNRAIVATVSLRGTSKGEGGTT